MKVGVGSGRAGRGIVAEPQKLMDKIVKLADSKARITARASSRYVGTLASAAVAYAFSNT